MIRDLNSLLANRDADIPYELTLSESEVAGLLKGRLDKSPALSVNLTHIGIHPDRVDVAGETSLAGMPINATASGQPRSELGGVRFELYSLELNGAPAPGFLRNQIVGQVNDRLSPERLPIQVDNIALHHGSVTITGKTKLRRKAGQI
jgi:hypothetical protein